MSEQGDEKKMQFESTTNYVDPMSARIRQAEKDGHFDNLPGKGKKLDLGRNYLNRSEAQLYKTLKDNHVLPAWIELGKEIDTLREKRKQCTGSDLKKATKELNKAIKKYNRACPPSLQKSLVEDE